MPVTMGRVHHETTQALLVTGLVVTSQKWRRRESNARDQSEIVLRGNNLQHKPLSVEAPGHRESGSGVQSLSSMDAIMLDPLLQRVILAWPLLSRERKDAATSINFARNG